METKKFRTKTEFIDRLNGNTPGRWVIGLDAGYSAVKIFSPNAIASCPSYAKRIDPDFEYAGKAPEDSILYKDLDTDEMWVVGAKAQDTMTSGDTSDSEMSLYGRERYGNPMFPVLIRVGLGLGMQGNAYGAPKDADEIIVQTGLPERYLADEPDLKDSIAGHHNFALKLGDHAWQKYNFTVKPENVFVMSQPKGALFSSCIQKNGRFHPDAQKYLTSSVLVFDPGFGTLDLFPIKAGVVGKGETNQTLGMKRVLQETAKMIRDQYDVSLQVPEMQKYLETGYVRYYDKKTYTSKDYPFENLLSAANDMVCEEAIEWLTSIVNLSDYNYLIITGGTGAAWRTKIKDKFKGLSTLQILSANQNDALPLIYANVRGYYLYRYNKQSV